MGRHSAGPGTRSRVCPRFGAPARDGDQRRALAPPPTESAIVPDTSGRAGCPGEPRPRVSSGRSPAVERRRGCSSGERGCRVGARPGSPPRGRRVLQRRCRFLVDAALKLRFTDLIYVHGFDIPLDQWDASATVERRLAKTADRLGMRLHLVRTNLRALLDQNVPWEIAHGVALAAVALLFAPICERVLIGAGMTYGELVDRGSHPLHDHLWSTEGCRIEHYGAHLRRSAKTEQVAKCQEALDTLRVCWRHVDLYNCGRCEKCLRTMVALEAVDALDRCPAFGVPLDLDAVASLRFYRSGSPDLVGREPRPRASAQRRRPRSHPGSVSHGQPPADRRPERRARGRRGASGQVGARAAGNPVVPLLATHRPAAPGGIRCPPGQPPRNRRLIASRSVDPRKRPIRVADRAARPCSYRSATLSERA